MEQPSALESKAGLSGSAARFIARSSWVHRNRGRLQFEGRALIASLPEAVIARDLDGVIESWNAAAQSLYGYSASEAIGKLYDLDD